MVEIDKLAIEMLKQICCGGAASVSVSLSDEQAKEFYNLLKSHDIAHIAASAEAAGLISFDEKARSVFEKQKLTAIYRYTHSQLALDSLSRVLEEAGILFVPLKGAVIRNYYPEPWMRTSCDIDILIHKEDLDNAISALNGAGFEQKYASTHDVSLYSKAGVHIELHFTLIEEGRANECSQVLQNVWDYIQPVNGCEYKCVMSDDMFYFYHIAHMAKHFEEGGCGIRSILDTWLINHSAEGNKEARTALLEKGHLLKFADACEALSEAWFGESEHTDMTLGIQEYILSGGVYGNVENRVALNYAKQGGGLRYMMSRIFAPYDKLKMVYPRLENRRILLPYYQIKRWIRIIRESGLRKLKGEMKAASELTCEQTNSAERLLSDLGIK